MEAQLVKELPDTNGWQYEPKWDGFRGVLENDGGEVALWSRNGRPLLRYFPELRPLGDLLPPHSALDGEIVIARDGVLDFDSMQMRLHPAESRVRKLAAEIPADFIVFDLLLWKGKSIHELPLEERRAELERVLGDDFHLSPTTGDAADAQKWLDRFEAAGLDGVIAKKLGLPYLPGSRDGVLKVKPYKTADCVIVGVRWKEKPTRIATLLLGLYGKGGKIDYVGSAAVAAGRHKEIFDRIEPLLKDAPDRGFS
jgi:ATP-dependent DNA ligase